ncbi:hypothetical protein SAMN05519104_6687 [Rhizobiales bacterium GAS188]|nr:hypothetical protein SAMN05519104_6687 [Rhizobiales bacterium GAS188]
MSGDPAHVPPERLRLDVSDEAMLTRLAKALPARTCLECGDGFSPQRPHAEFCCAPCRKTFANRRAQRGADLYDLFMASRFDLATAKDLKLWRMMNRLASHFRAEDKRIREGRRSWMRPGDSLAAKAFLFAEHIAPAKRRGR